MEKNIVFTTTQKVITAYNQGIISKVTYDNFMSQLEVEPDEFLTMSTINHINIYIDSLTNALL